MIWSKCMQKICRIALAVSFSLASISLFAFDSADTLQSLPVLEPESQHTTASKRISARFTRDHYKLIKINDALSQKVFDRFIKQLDYARNVFFSFRY